MIAGSHSPQRGNSFQGTSYEYLTCCRPKSRNIAVLSPHPPVIGPHAPEDLTTVILGFTDRGSAGSHGRRDRPINGTLRETVYAKNSLMNLDFDALGFPPVQIKPDGFEGEC